MALDLNSVKLLLWAKNLGVSFERILTLGRQNLYCSRAKLKCALRDFGIPATPEQIDRCFQHEVFHPVFADEFLRLLGAQNPVSVDQSDFEGATLLHDLNDPFPEQLHGQFDLVLDGGTLEHIFDYPKALRNCMELVRIGGHLVTITPSSGHTGHGFYQFSPELFFRVFSADNGFALRKIVFFDVRKEESTFYEVNDPYATGQRGELRTGTALLLFVLAEKIANVPVFANRPQQSDYAADWAAHQKKKTVDEAAVPSGWWRQLRMKVNPYWPQWLRRWREHWRYRSKFGAPNLGNRRNYRKLGSKEMFQTSARGK